MSQQLYFVTNIVSDISKIISSNEFDLLCHKNYI